MSSECALEEFIFLSAFSNDVGALWEMLSHILSTCEVQLCSFGCDDYLEARLWRILKCCDQENKFDLIRSEFSCWHALMHTLLNLTSIYYCSYCLKNEIQFIKYHRINREFLIGTLTPIRPCHLQDSHEIDIISLKFPKWLT